MVHANITTAAVNIIIMSHTTHSFALMVASHYFW